MANRLLVMNGQKILQTKEGDGWSNVKVSKGGGIKPGIYNLFSAKNAESNGTYEGQVVHKDKDIVYQKTPKGLIAHSSMMREDQKEDVAEGQNVSISYEGGKSSLRIGKSHEKTTRRSR